MKNLSTSSFNQASKFISDKGRSLEKQIFQSYFSDGDSKKILNELEKFQNNDGGFGKGLEGDFRLPLSSSMATSAAFNHLVKYDHLLKALDMIKSGIKYFEHTFDSKRNGWFVVPKEVNDYPHAPWWHYIQSEGMTIIDRNWGNPSVEIIAYLYKYKGFVSAIDVEKLLSYAIDYFNKKEKFEAENEVYCYIRLYNVLPYDIASKIENKLILAVGQVLCDKKEEWNNYVPQPLNFVSSPKAHRFGISNELIEENLDFLVEKLESNGKIEPPWNWHDLKSFIDPNWNWDAYDPEWEKAKIEWTGVLTLKALITLDKFSRIDL